MKNKIIAAILGAIMIFSVFFTVIPSVFAVQNTVTISSTEDFIKFSKNCTLDTWSHGKTVNLTCDIDFTDADFSPAPTFGGTFNGNGHTLSGIKYSKNGSYIGIFRYIQQEGKIKNLNIKAEITPNGSKCFIGGIVGENHGTLELCSFDGTVKGQDIIGGIAGDNADDGQIIDCTSDGSIIGENSTGGIAGKNSGFIQNCTNNAAVNTVYEEKKKDISDIDADTATSPPPSRYSTSVFRLPAATSVIRISLSTVGDTSVRFGLKGTLGPRPFTPELTLQDIRHFYDKFRTKSCIVR